MKPDNIIREDVEDELRWEFGTDPADVVVNVKDGVVAITGYVRSFNEKWQAEDAARRVAGVVGIANDLEIRLPELDQRPDPEIARDVVRALAYELPEAADELRITVSNGTVTIEGEVRWYFDRLRAERVAGRVRGVAEVKNAVRVKPVMLPVDVEKSIRAALKRNHLTSHAKIDVEIRGTQAILRGTVDSWPARNAAEEAAGRAPGIAQVENLITVRGSESPT
ncbi:MAG TPA: BON domain-containing protein [Devosiaceae bacterium]|nr:BON domain-containing protein [Devosiaceae bacterium]